MENMLRYNKNGIDVKLELKFPPMQAAEFKWAYNLAKDQCQKGYDDCGYMWVEDEMKDGLRDISSRFLIIKRTHSIIEKEAAEVAAKSKLQQQDLDTFCTEQKEGSCTDVTVGVATLDLATNVSAAAQSVPASGEVINSNYVSQESVVVINDSGSCVKDNNEANQTDENSNPNTAVPTASSAGQLSKAALKKKAYQQKQKLFKQRGERFDTRDLLGYVQFGFGAQGAIVDEMDGPPTLFVYGMQLKEEVQRKGLGSYIMKLLELIARKNNMSFMTISVVKGMTSFASMLKSKCKGYGIDPTYGEDDVQSIMSKSIAGDQKKSAELENMINQIKAAKEKEALLKANQKAAFTNSSSNSSSTSTAETAATASSTTNSVVEISGSVASSSSV
jgi:hypothetical protein